MPKEKETKDSTSWKKVLGSIAETLTQQATNSIVELTKHSIQQINEEKNKAVANFKRKIMSGILMCLGMVFFLIGLVVVINDYFNKDSLGYILVGLAIIITGLWIGKKSNQ